jgi:hypothetical protein
MGAAVYESGIGTECQVPELIQEDGPYTSDAGQASLARGIGRDESGLGLFARTGPCLKRPRAACSYDGSGCIPDRRPPARTGGIVEHRFNHRIEKVTNADGRFSRQTLRRLPASVRASSDVE